MFKRTSTQTQPVDPALQEIAAWEQWFLTGQLTVLREQHLDEATFATERARAEALTAAVVARMRDDYAARTPRS